MSTFHHWIGTWQTKVDAFLCSTYFYRDIFTRAGFPSNKIVISPLFTTQKGKLSTAKKIEDYAVFVGRLDPEKGVKTLLEAWCLLNFPLKIRGSGRLDETARDFVRCHRMDHVEFVGRLEEQELSDLIGSARFLIMPSEGYYETFGLVIIEAYSRGVPVIASNIGVAPELVSDRQTGLLFEPGNPQDLADKARWMWNHPAEASTMGKNGLNTYKDRFTQEQCYKTLVEVYKRLIDSK